MFAHTQKKPYLCIVKRIIKHKALYIQYVLIQFKGKKIMVFMMTFAVVAVMIAQAVNVENKLD